MADRRLEKRCWPVLMFLVVGCGPKGPPPDLAPDPGLASRIQEIAISPLAQGGCPGEIIRTSYTAVLDDGSELPFATRYDRDNPPPLHVVMLGRTSPDASPRENGDWNAGDDPLRTAMDGFRLSAFLRANPSANGFVTVRPTYDCARHVYNFTGGSGNPGAGGEDGPNLAVRVGILASPFYERLLVVGIEVGMAPPYYVLANADAVPPADWIRVTSRGGNGGRGVKGTAGAVGPDGEPGCRGSAGGAGGAGGNGGPGGPGGNGGRITVVAPTEEPFLAGLVDGRSLAGRGGKGGTGGEGGAGGKGGEARDVTNRRCQAGADGSAGPNGSDGADGPNGAPGPLPDTVIRSLEEVFGLGVPPTLAALIDYAFNRP